jgi:hypothetical protein
MSELIEGQAIAVPDQATLENFNNLSIDEQQKVSAQVAGMASITADEALKSAQGYDILTQLYTTCGQLILNTSPWVLPVKHQMEEIKATLSDPEGFHKGFRTLCTDISNYNANLGVLHEVHKGKTGQPAPEDVGDILLLADGYNKLASHYEDGIQPLMVSLAAVVEREYLPTLEKEVDAIA